MHLLLPILPLIFSTTYAQICYFPNGNPLPNDGTFYSSMRPCTSPGLETICCATDRSNPPGTDVSVPGNIQDECLPNGLCQNRKIRNGSDWTTFHANYCTDKNFNSGKCLNICDQTRGSGGGTRVTSCNGKADSERWCCGDTSACCESNIGVVKIAQIFGGTVSSSSSSASLSLSTVGLSASRSSSSTATTTSSSIGAQAEQDSGEDGLGGGVIAGAVIGALAGLAVLAAVVLCALRRRRNGRSGRLDFAEGSVAPPQYRQHEELRYEKDANNQLAEMEQPRSELTGGNGGVHEKADNEGRAGLRAHQGGVAELSGSEVR